MKRIILKFLKYSMSFLLALIITLNLFILLSGKFYMYKGIANTYLIGNTGPTIYDLHLSPYSIVQSAKVPLKNLKSGLFNQFKLTEIIDKKYYYYGDILGKKLNSKINSFKLLKLLNQIQNNIKKEILETKSNLSSQKDIEIKIFNVFKSINFLPLEKNPIKIKPSELKIIITKVIN